MKISMNKNVDIQRQQLIVDKYNGLLVLCS